MPLPSLCLVLGGASSGKSRFAEGLALNAGNRPVYLATATASDAEMAAKIAAHKKRRKDRWEVFETPLDPLSALKDAGPDAPVLLDCATLWLTNHLIAENDLDAQSDALVAGVSAAAQPVIVVSNEVGQGIVPEHALSRRFRDAQGRLNQALAAEADLVVQVIAGLPNVLKGRLP